MVILIIAALVYNHVTKKSIISELFQKLPCVTSGNDNAEIGKQNDQDGVDFEAVPIKPAEPEVTIIDETDNDELNKKE